MGAWVVVGAWVGCGCLGELLMPGWVVGAWVSCGWLWVPEWVVGA